MWLKKILLPLLIVLIITVFPFLAQAKTNFQNTFEAFGNGAGIAPTGAETPTEPILIITTIIKIALSFLGVIFLILIIISGFKWMTTSSPDEIKKIRAKITNAVIGLVIVLAAYGITTFISSAIFTSLQAPIAQ